MREVCKTRPKKRHISDDETAVEKKNGERLSRFIFCFLFTNSAFLKDMVKKCTKYYLPSHFFRSYQYQHNHVLSFTLLTKMLTHHCLSTHTIQFQGYKVFGHCHHLAKRRGVFYPSFPCFVTVLMNIHRLLNRNYLFSLSPLLSTCPNFLHSYPPSSISFRNSQPTASVPKSLKR